jgi:hypothetical protein
MTELATRAEGVELEYAGGLVAWAQEARAAASIAVSLAKTSFVPASLRSDDRDRGAEITAAQITAAILAGQELGLSPMSALRSIDIIEGAPALRAVAMRGLVQSKGHDIWPGPTSATRVVMFGKRKGTDNVVEREWTIERARSMGITTNRKGETKQNWTRQPENMLIARGTSEMCRLIAADVLLGMPYSVEELLDQADVGEVAEPKKRTTARRKTEPVETPEPVLELAVEPEPVDKSGWPPVEDMVEPELDP